MANPSDGLLLRRWCAQNDTLANSAIFARLRHQDNKKPLFESLLNLPHSVAFENMTALERKHYDAVCELVEQIKSAFAQEKSGAHMSFPSNTNLQTSYKCAPEDMEAGGIVLCPIESLVGLNPDIVILFGAANGTLLPKDYSDLSKMVVGHVLLRSITISSYIRFRTHSMSAVIDERHMLWLPSQLLRSSPFTFSAYTHFGASCSPGATLCANRHMQPLRFFMAVQISF